MTPLRPLAPVTAVRALTIAALLAAACGGGVRPPPSDPVQNTGTMTGGNTQGSGGDRDGDGVGDHEDVCPDDPEDFDGFEDEDGCPDLDDDRDGIHDIDDSCPQDPESQNGVDDEDGCPD